MSHLTPKSLKLITILAFAVVSFSTPAAADDCAPPPWVKLVELRKKPDELVAAAAGATPGSAYISAKRKIAERFVAQYANELMRLPQLKGKLNTKIYIREDIVKALPNAVSYNIREPRRLEYEAVCDQVYIALLVYRKELISQLRQQEDFAEHINLSLTGKLGPLEEAAFQKSNQSDAADLGGSETVLKNLNDLAKTIDPEDYLEKDMLVLLRQRISSLKKTADNARSLTFKDEREKEVLQVKSKISEAGRISTAIKDFKKKEYISAIEIFQKCGRDGEVSCQYIVGIMHIRALGVKKNMPEGLKWLKKAADRDHTVSKLFLGIYTFAGIGTRSDPELATKLVNEAFRQGWTCDLEVKSCSKEK